MTKSIFHRIALASEAEAEKALLEIEVLAEIIAEKMHYLHGDRYRAHTDHEVGLVLVRALAGKSAS